MTFVAAFLIGCAVLLVLGGSGVRAETSQEKQVHSEATGQGHSGGAAPEVDRCGKLVIGRYAISRSS
jgi:hypothetical protein